MPRIVSLVPPNYLGLLDLFCISDTTYLLSYKLVVFPQVLCPFTQCPTHKGNRKYGNDHIQTWIYNRAVPSAPAVRNYSIRGCKTNHLPSKLLQYKKPKRPKTINSSEARVVWFQGSLASLGKGGLTKLRSPDTGH